VHRTAKQTTSVPAQFSPVVRPRMNKLASLPPRCPLNALSAGTCEGRLAGLF
jgi:hypothetical protein